MFIKTSRNGYINSDKIITIRVGRYSEYMFNQIWDEKDVLRDDFLSAREEILSSIGAEEFYNRRNDEELSFEIFVVCAEVEGLKKPSILSYKFVSERECKKKGVDYKRELEITERELQVYVSDLILKIALNA